MACPGAPKTGHEYVVNRPCPRIPQTRLPWHPFLAPFTMDIRLMRARHPATFSFRLVLARLPVATPPRSQNGLDTRAPQLEAKKQTLVASWCRKCPLPQGQPRSSGNFRIVFLFSAPVGLSRYSRAGSRRKPAIVVVSLNPVTWSSMSGSVGDTCSRGGITGAVAACQLKGQRCFMDADLLDGADTGASWCCLDVARPVAFLARRSGVWNC